jgi:ribonuclease-3 family protein
MIRQVMAGQLSKVEASHKWTTKRASAAFQVQLLQVITPQLSEIEQALAKRARNSPVSVGRRSQQAVHRQATAFEALLGYWYAQDQARLVTIFSNIQTMVLSGEVVLPPQPE